MHHNCDSLLIRMSQLSKEKIMPYILLTIFVQLLNNCTAVSKFLGRGRWRVLCSQRRQIFHFLLILLRNKTVFSIKASPHLPYKPARMENSWSLAQAWPAIQFHVACNNLVFYTRENPYFSTSLDYRKA